MEKTEAVADLPKVTWGVGSRAETRILLSVRLWGPWSVSWIAVPLPTQYNLLAFHMPKHAAECVCQCLESQDERTGLCGRVGLRWVEVNGKLGPLLSDSRVLLPLPQHSCAAEELLRVSWHYLFVLGFQIPEYVTRTPSTI